MSKTFMYFNKTGEYAGSDGSWDGDEGFWFEYEPDEDKLKKVVVDLLFFESFSKEIINTFSDNQVAAIKKTLKDLIDNNDNWEELYEDFEEEIKDYFEDKAFESIR